MNNKLFPITGVGSLPHPHFDSALSHILKYDLPFLPQLPNRSPKETMIYQSLDGIGDLDLENGGTVTINSLYDQQLQRITPNQQSYSSLLPFAYEVNEKGITQVKIQFTGPYTLLKYSTYEKKNNEFFKTIGQFLIDKIKHTVALFSNTTIFLQIDEPALFLLSGDEEQLQVKEFYLELLLLKSEKLKLGFHCCSNIQWNTILKLPIDFISFDVGLSIDSLLKNSEKLLNIPHLFLGILPTSPGIDIQHFDSQEQANNLITRLKSHYSDVKMKDLLKKVFLTPACGLGQKKVSVTEEYILKLRDFQNCLRKIYFE